MGAGLSLMAQLEELRKSGVRFGAGDHWSGKLDEWLSAALASGAYERYVWLDGDIGDDEQDGPDEDETVLEWTDRRWRGVQTWSFPTDDLRSEYLSSVAGRPESEVFALLRLFLLDAIAIIRARWIEDAKSGVEALFHISPRAFELLMAALYLELGYEVVVTPPQRDGGRDVIARKNLAGRSEVVEIECKAHTSAIGVDVVRAPRGVVGGNGSNRGVVVTTSRVTRGAVKIAADDHRIELVDGATLVQLLNSVSVGVGSTIARGSAAPWKHDHRTGRGTSRRGRGSGTVRSCPRRRGP